MLFLSILLVISFECNVKDVFDSKVSFNFECENFVEYQILDKM